MNDNEGSNKVMLQVDRPGLVTINHRSSYGAITPLRPELSQAGRTVLITGASAGIGLSTARAFAEASATTVIITGRRKDKIEAVVSDLSNEFRKTKFEGRVCDVSSDIESTALWDGLKADSVVVDVLVLSAAKFSGHESILDSGLEAIWSLVSGSLY